MQMDLDIDVDERFANRVDTDLLRRTVERVLLGEGITGTVELSVTVSDDDTIRRLNARYRGIDVPTDVLSFPLHSQYPGPSNEECAASCEEKGKEAIQFVLPPDEVLYLGDVVVSFPRALEQAKDYGHSLERELSYLVAHGVLHLLGYDHETEEQRRQMRLREEAALVGLRGDVS